MKTLKMVFEMDNENTITISLKDPKEGLTQMEVEAVAQNIINKQLLVAGGSYAEHLKEAYIYSVDKDELQ